MTSTDDQTNSLIDKENNLLNINNDKSQIITDNQNPFADLNKQESNLFPALDNEYIKDDDYQGKFNSDFKRHKNFLIAVISILIVGIIVTGIMSFIYYKSDQGCQENPSMGRPFFTCPDGEVAVWKKPDGTIDDLNNIFY